MENCYQSSFWTMQILLCSKFRKASLINHFFKISLRDILIITAWRRMSTSINFNKMIIEPIVSISPSFESFHNEKWSLVQIFSDWKITPDKNINTPKYHLVSYKFIYTCLIFNRSLFQILWDKNYPLKIPLQNFT